MKIAFVGGGAIRLFGILRSAMGDRRIFPEGGEICLYDLANQRAETLGRLLMKTPEYASGRFTITWPLKLDDALGGASMVGVVLSPGSRETAGLSDAVSYDHGFITSDNVSPTGGMFAVKGGEVLMSVARAMERLCPDAWLVDFANPVAVFSGMVNNHTKIKALGVCAGFMNHLWDVARILGEDRMLGDFDVRVAGINHLSFIVKGTVGGSDVFGLIDEALKRGWKMPEASPRWSESSWKNITYSVTSLIEFYRDLNVLIFSTEGDGMAHLRFDKEIANMKAGPRPASGEELSRKIAHNRSVRAEGDVKFAAYLDRDLDATFWSQVESRDRNLASAPDNIFLRILRGMVGPEPVHFVASRLNEGAVSGFDDRTVVEYSQVMTNGTITPYGDLSVPPVVRGLVTSLAVHQTMLGDAIATQDPKLLAHALLCYPWESYTQKARAFYRDLITVNAPDIPEPLRQAVNYL